MADIFTMMIPIMHTSNNEYSIAKLHLGSGYIVLITVKILSSFSFYMHL